MWIVVAFCLLASFLCGSTATEIYHRAAAPWLVASVAFAAIAAASAAWVNGGGS